MIHVFIALDITVKIELTWPKSIWLVNSWRTSQFVDQSILGYSFGGILGFRSPFIELTEPSQSKMVVDRLATCTVGTLIDPSFDSIFQLQPYIIVIYLGKRYAVHVCMMLCREMILAHSIDQGSTSIVRHKLYWQGNLWNWNRMRSRTRLWQRFYQ